MDKALALQIFTLGVRYGAYQGELGLEIAKIKDNELAEILYQGFIEYDAEIEKHCQNLITQKATADWYAQNWTVKQSFHFGLMAMFEEYPKIPADKKGIKFLADEVIDKLTQSQFRSCKQFGDDEK